MKIFRSIYNFLVVVLVFLSFACNQGSTEKVIEARYPDDSPKIVKYYKQKGQTKEVVKEVDYYANKNVRLEGEYKNGQRDGRWVYYYENGNIWSEGFFKAGLNEGIRTTYYENGHKRFDGSYKNDQRVGIWRFYDESGKQVNLLDYGNGSKSPLNQSEK